MKLSRGIWLYDLDPLHSFSRYYEAIRWNLVVMGLLMVNNFPSGYCAPDVQRFVPSFMDAQLSSMVNTGKLAQQSFKAQEDFIKLWKEGELDLIEFTRGDAVRTKKLIKKLEIQSLPPALQIKIGDSPDHIVEMRRTGTITDDEFKKYWPAPVHMYCLFMSDIDKQQRNALSKEKDMQERMMEEQLGKQFLGKGHARRRVP